MKLLLSSFFPTLSLSAVEEQKKKSVKEAGLKTCFLWRLTCTPAQVFDVDLLLLHAGRLSDQTRVVVGVPVGGADRVVVVAAAVDVAYTPGSGQRLTLAGASFL